MKHCRVSIPWRFLAFLLLLTALSASFSASVMPPSGISKPTSIEKARIGTVILDAGHGGEDGGAVSASGIAEKDLNLQITLLLKELLEANGIRVILTRSEDVLLYDRNTDYHGRKKALDLSARLKIAEAHPEAVFVSIHMNTYPLESCRGLQVWYSPNDTRSRVLASEIQERARTLLDPQNERRIKEAGSSIYLLHHVQSPAILVECGFLTNPEEAERLSTREYQQNLAIALFLSIVHTEFEAEEA